MSLRKKPKSITKKHLKTLISDEHSASKEYGHLSRVTKDNWEEDRFREMSNDEARHEGNLTKMLDDRSRVAGWRTHNPDYVVFNRGRLEVIAHDAEGVMPSVAKRHALKTVIVLRKMGVKFDSISCVADKDRLSYLMDFRNEHRQRVVGYFEKRGFKRIERVGDPDEDIRYETKGGKTVAHAVLEYGIPSSKVRGLLAKRWLRR